MNEPHLGDELSALLDGELAPEEHEGVEAHLAGCEICRSELEATRAVRDRVRSAGPVDPPFGFYERLTSKRRRWPAAATAAAAIAVASACVVIVGFVIQPGPATRTPPVDALRAVASEPSNASGGLSLHRVERSTLLPTQLAGLPRQSTFKAFVEGGDAIVGVFGVSPDRTLVAYVVRGNVDWTQLHGGIRSPVEGLPGNPWRSIDANAMPAIVVQAGENTVLVTGTVPQDTLAQAAKEIGDPAETSAVDRIRDAANSLVDGFGLH